MFGIRKILTGDSLPLEYYPASEVIELGQALVLENGHLKKASVAANYVCCGEKTSNELYPTLRVRDDIEFVVPSSVKIGAELIGSALEINADAKSINATVTANGGFIVTATDANEPTSTVFGYFK